MTTLCNVARGTKDAEVHGTDNAESLHLYTIICNSEIFQLNSFKLMQCTTKYM